MSQDHHLADDEIVALLEQMFDEYDIGFTGHNHPNGADSYYCSCCMASHTIKGDALGRQHITAFEHGNGCNAWKLYQMLQEDEPDHEAIIEIAEEMLDSSELALIARHNNNGADYYECPACLTDTKIKGFACGSMPVSFGEHSEDCNLLKLYLAIQERNRQAD